MGGRLKDKPLKFKIRQLEAFRAVAETGSMTKAANQLGISQPAVSRLVSDFSNTVGFEVFQRHVEFWSLQVILAIY